MKMLRTTEEEENFIQKNNKKKLIKEELKKVKSLEDIVKILEKLIEEQT